MLPGAAELLPLQSHQRQKFRTWDKFRSLIILSLPPCLFLSPSLSLSVSLDVLLTLARAQQQILMTCRRQILKEEEKELILKQKEQILKQEEKEQIPKEEQVVKKEQIRFKAKS